MNSRYNLTFKVCDVRSLFLEQLSLSTLYTHRPGVGGIFRRGGCLFTLDGGEREQRPLLWEGLHYKSLVEITKRGGGGGTRRRRRGLAFKTGSRLLMLLHSREGE